MVNECRICHRKSTIMIDGICQHCYWEQQDEEDRRVINNASFPEGFIATWNDSPSFLSKKRDYMYFRIPNNQRVFFDPEKRYQIIVKEGAK
jgi:hypothetical protein